MDGRFVLQPNFNNLIQFVHMDGGGCRSLGRFLAPLFQLFPAFPFEVITKQLIIPAAANVIFEETLGMEEIFIGCVVKPMPTHSIATKNEKSKKMSD
jgi:hypothetical protein